jgi:PAS domain-containing protein
MKLPERRRSWPVVSVFVFIVLIQLVVAVASIEMMSSVRAYVTGESLYSKGQKDAQIHMIDYAEGHKERDYQLFLDALAVPLGLRVAREALQLPTPDVELARQGHIRGGTHPDDIEGAIRLFQWFQHVSFMADAITIWTEGDAVIEQMRTLVERAHERVVAGDLNAAAIKEMRDMAPVLNKRMTRLESDFSAQLGLASRETQRVLLALNLGIGVLLALTGLAFVRHSARAQAAIEGEVRRRQESLQRLLDSTAEGLYGVDLDGRCTFINRAALGMLGYEREKLFNFCNRSRQTANYNSIASFNFKTSKGNHPFTISNDTTYNGRTRKFQLLDWSISDF